MTKKKFAKFRHIDTTGLPKGFDIADLVDSGVTGKELMAWLKDRVRNGPPGPHMLTPEDEKKKREKARRKNPPKRPAPAAVPASSGNVAPLRQPQASPRVEEDPIPIDHSEDSVAYDFVTRYRESVAYCSTHKHRWLVWQNNMWAGDETGEAFELVREVCRDHAKEVDADLELGNKRKTIAGVMSKYNFMRNVETLASTDRRIVVRQQQLDADPWIINTPDGVVDLKAGKLRPAKRGEWCTKQAAVGPSNAKHPCWSKFLEDCTDGDEDLARYLQRVAGYCLTGSIAEQVFFFAYGTGGNGKGTYMNTLYWLLNDYARHAQMETFTEQRFVKHATEIAYFQGARVVTASETTAGSRWNEQRIKSMTGGDPITANYMRKDPFTFLPTFKLLFAGNTKPHLRNVDAAIKRRMYLIPFDVEIPEDERDGKLDEKLRAEGAAIMRWAVEGCLDWQENSLDPPDRVIATTREYFDAEDKIGCFLDDCIGTDKARSVKSTWLFERWVRWAEAHNEYVGNHRTFLDMMASKGYRPRKVGGESLFEGLFIAYDSDAGDDPTPDQREPGIPF